MIDSTSQLAATWPLRLRQLVPPEPDGTRNVPFERRACSSDLEIGLIAARLTGPFSDVFQTAVANASIAAFDRSSVSAIGSSTVLLASSTNDVSARVT